MKRHQFFSRDEIIIGNNLGKLTIVSTDYKVLRSGQRKGSVVAKCSCGNIVETLVDNILTSPNPMCKKCITLNKRCCKIGDRFDKLVIIDFVSSDGACKTLAFCKCDCGNEKTIRPDMLKKNKSNDCGCVLSPQWQGYGGLSLTYYSNVRRNASIRKIDISVSIEYLWSLFEKQNGLCALTGIPITLGRRFTKDLQSASLDRIDNNKGYVNGNVWWVHKDINSLKTDFSLQRFLELCSLVSEFNSNK
jgi:hypothetical protein